MMSDGTAASASSSAPVMRLPATIESPCQPCQVQLKLEIDRLYALNAERARDEKRLGFSARLPHAHETHPSDSARS